MAFLRAWRGILCAVKEEIRYVTFKSQKAEEDFTLHTLMNTRGTGRRLDTSVNTHQLESVGKMTVTREKYYDKKHQKKYKSNKAFKKGEVNEHNGRIQPRRRGTTED